MARKQIEIAMHVSDLKWRKSSFHAFYWWCEDDPQPKINKEKTHTTSLQI